MRPLCQLQGLGAEVALARAPAPKQERDFGKKRAGKVPLSLNPVHLGVSQH